MEICSVSWITAVGRDPTTSAEGRLVLDTVRLKPARSRLLTGLKTELKPRWRDFQESSLTGS